MKLVVCGPNLRANTDEVFHVHKQGCMDLAKYGPGKRYGGDDGGWFLEAPTRRHVVEDVYPPEDFGYDASDYGWYRLDLRFFPCCKELPE